MVVLGHSPGSSGVVLVVQAAALIPLLQQTLWILCHHTIAQNAGYAGRGAGMEVDVKHVIPVFQNVIGISPDNHAGTLLGQLKNDAALHIP